MPFMGLTKEQKSELEKEVVSKETRLKLTRILRDKCNISESGLSVYYRNRFINIANGVLGRPILVLESDDSYDIEPIIQSWHLGELELILKLPSTPLFTEIIADFIQEQLLTTSEVNEVLKKENCSFLFDWDHSQENVELNILAISDLEKQQERYLAGEHPSIRLLVNRMQNSLKENDPAGVLHSAASIFETLAKDVTANPNNSNQTLGSFFAQFKNISKLPDKITDYILETYKARNSEPLAGHGSLATPTITKAQAIILCELTIAIVKIERQLDFFDAN